MVVSVQSYANFLLSLLDHLVLTWGRRYLWLFSLHDQIFARSGENIVIVVVVTPLVTPTLKVASLQTPCVFNMATLGGRTLLGGGVNFSKRKWPPWGVHQNLVFGLPLWGCPLWEGGVRAFGICTHTFFSRDCGIQSSKVFNQAWCGARRWCVPLPFGYEGRTWKPCFVHNG